MRITVINRHRRTKGIPIINLLYHSHILLHIVVCFYYAKQCKTASEMRRNISRKSIENFIILFLFIFLTTLNQILKSSQFSRFQCECNEFGVVFWLNVRFNKSMQDYNTKTKFMQTQIFYQNNKRNVKKKNCASVCKKEDKKPAQKWLHLGLYTKECVMRHNGGGMGKSSLGPLRISTENKDKTLSTHAEKKFDANIIFVEITNTQ